MIDRITGEIRLEDQNIVLGPTLRREDLEKSSLAGKMRPFIMDGPWVSWNIGDHLIAARPFNIVVFFHHDDIFMVEMNLSPKVLPVDFDRRTEHQRKAAHDRFLLETLGLSPARPEGDIDQKLPWARVSSVIDDRRGGSFIRFRYREPQG